MNVIQILKDRDNEFYYELYKEEEFVEYIDDLFFTPIQHNSIESFLNKETFSLSMSKEIGIFLNLDSELINGDLFLVIYKSNINPYLYKFTNIIGSPIDKFLVLSQLGTNKRKAEYLHFTRGQLKRFKHQDARFIFEVHDPEYAYILIKKDKPMPEIILSTE